MKNKIGKKKVNFCFLSSLEACRGKKSSFCFLDFRGSYYFSRVSCRQWVWGGGGRGRGDKKLDFQLIGNEVGS